MHRSRAVILKVFIVAVLFLLKSKCLCSMFFASECEYIDMSGFLSSCRLLALKHGGPTSRTAHLFPVRIQDLRDRSDQPALANGWLMRCQYSWLQVSLWYSSGGVPRACATGETRPYSVLDNHTFVSCNGVHSRFLIHVPRVPPRQ